MLTTATTRAARPRASVDQGKGITGYLRDAVTCLSGTDQRHVLLVYDRDGHLVCWCGPYTAGERLAQATIWGSDGWRWTRTPAANQDPGPLLRLGDMMVMIG